MDISTVGQTDTLHGWTDGQPEKKTLLQLIHRGFETETNDLFTHSEVTHDKID